MSNNDDWASGYTGTGSGYGPEWEMGRLDRERNDAINRDIAASRTRLNNKNDVGLVGGSGSSSDTMVFITTALLLASMAGMSAHSWWVFAATIVAFTILTIAAQKYFATSTGQKVFEILRKLVFVAAIAGILVFSFMQWSWQGLMWSTIIMATLAVISGLHYFFTQTEAGEKAGTFLAYIIAAVIAIYFTYVVMSS